jgi:membrane protease YdiL (CAAX protease family)
LSQSSDASGDETKPFVELFRAGSLFEADELVLALADAGMPARIENELLQGGLGELPPGWDTLPKVMVPEQRLSEARVIQVQLQAAVSARASQDDCCLACNEPMLNVETCESCDWSWNDNNDLEPDEPAQVESLTPSPDNSSAANDRDSALVEERSIKTAPNGRTARELWIELSAVMAVSVIPSLEGALQTSFEPLVTSYASGSIHLLVFSVCSAWIVIYIIRSHGESLSDFGIARPQRGDIFVGVLMVPLTHLMMVVYYTFIPMSADIAPEYEFVSPASKLDYALMVVADFANAFHEELVLRAYLITRLYTLLKYQRRAVVVAALVFAS